MVTAAGANGAEQEVRTPSAPRITRVANADATFCEIVQFLTDESAMLDDNDLMGWLGILADDILYTAPVRRTVSRHEGTGFDASMTHFDDDIESLTFRIHRFLDSENAFADDPPSRTRRFTTNFAVWTTDSQQEYFVRSNLLVTRSRWDAPTFDLLSCRREDVVRRTDDGLRIARRTILFDQAMLGTPNLAIFL